MADLVVQNDIGFKRRNPWGVFLLSIITLGVYHIVWWYKINNELRNYGIQNDPAVATLAITLGAFIVVPPLVSWYKTADRIKQAQEASNASERMIPILGLVVFVVIGAIAPVYYQSQLNKVWDALARAGAQVMPA
jgi:uncharacterized membrane protein